MTCFKGPLASKQGHRGSSPDWQQDFCSNQPLLLFPPFPAMRSPEAWIQLTNFIHKEGSRWPVPMALPVARSLNEWSQLQFKPLHSRPLRPHLVAWLLHWQENFFTVNHRSFRIMLLNAQMNPLPFLLKLQHLQLLTFIIFIHLTKENILNCGLVFHVPMTLQQTETPLVESGRWCFLFWIVVKNMCHITLLCYL